MAKHIDLVRYRNDGDDFHILWTARRALRLLDPTSNLAAVSVEGVSEQEAGKAEEVDEGLLVIDTTEYYGSEALTEATQVAYYQLKYSTTAPDLPWTLSGLKGTLKGFAERFKGLCAQYNPATVNNIVLFRFVSNRPIHEVVTAAFEAAAAGEAPRKLNPGVYEIIRKLRRITKLNAVEFKSFAALVDLWGDQETRWTQSANLQAEAVRFTPFLDINAALNMKELVRSKTTSDAAQDKTIRLNTLLRAFGLGNEKELLPAAPRFESVPHTITRIQESDIIQSILDAQSPVIVHALAGVGKSILAQRLPRLLPEGSEAVVFDGFAAGAYRSSVDRRHKHSHGLVQIANTLAKRGLCDVLLPIPASEEDYLRAFLNRLEQAVAVVRGRSPNAVLLIVLDAADNSGIAAGQYQERCFIPDLLRLAPPVGCRIVALARSHRVDEFLHPPTNVIRILLEPFTIDESAEHLRSRFSQASDTVVEEFHRLTDKNPRVQANALALASNLSDLMQTLGPTIHTVEDLIKGQLTTALNKVIEEQASPRSEIDSLCIALAALPPLVPIRVLSMAANMSEAAIRSFATDFAGGRPILIHDDAVQFRDEPVETWFRENFAATANQNSHIVNLLSPMAPKDGYIAAALPLLLWGANRYRELIDLALLGEELETDDPVEKREVLLSRIQYALRAALVEKNFEDSVKLLLRLGEEVATNERQAGFLMDNFDLVASLAGADVVYDFIFRKRAWNISVTPYVYPAAMLAGNRQYQVETRRFLELSLDWLLNEWARTPSDKRQQISAEAITAYAWTCFHLDGPAAAARFLARWTPPTVSFEAGSILAKRLIDSGNIDSAQELLVAAKGNIFLKLAVILELSRVCVSPAKDQILSIIRMLGAKRSQIDLSKISEDINVGLAIVTVAEAAARIGLPKSDILTILDRYQVIPKRVIRSYDPGSLRESMFREFALRAALDGRSLTMDDVMPESIREELKKPNADHRSEVREFRELYGALLPWYRLRALALVNGINEGELKDLLIAAQKECKTDRWGWGGNYELTFAVNEIGRVWLDVLVWSGFITKENSHQLGEWLASQKIMIFTPTWTSLARCMAHRPEIHEICLEFANRAREMIEAEHGEARGNADSLSALARATFPLAKSEAASYFQLALEHLSRIGDESYERLSSLMTIAIRGGQKAHPEPRQAYRFARIVELFHAYNDHKFPWPDAAVTLASLCPASGFAIVSRWNDRDKGSLDETLPPMVMALLEKDILSPAVVAAFHAFPGHWRLYDQAHLFLDKETDPGRRQEILDILVRDQEFRGNPEGTTKALLQAARRHQLRCDRLDELEVFSTTKIGDSAEPKEPEVSITQRSTEQEPDWADILAEESFDSTEGIDKSIAKYCSNVRFYKWSDLFQQMRSVLKPQQRAEHVVALAGSSVQVHLLIDALEAIATEWNTSVAVRQAIGKAIKFIVKNRPHDLVNHWWGTRKEVERCARLSGMSKDEIFSILLKAMADHIGNVSAGGLFYLAGDIAWDVLTPAQSLDTLTFGLDRLEPLLKETDGDGPWTDNLMPPADVHRAVAGFLYAMLASPKPEKRWRAGHAIRRLCRFQQNDIIAALVGLLGIEELPPFTDAGLPFYAWHARLYLLIALARASLDVPDVLLPHLPIFIHWALNGPPHVLMRHFAAQAALAIAQAHPDAITAGIVERLKAVNVSPFEPATEEREVGRDMRTWKETDFHFPYDFDKYWLNPLADVFNITYAEVAKIVESWIIEKWQKDTRGSWDKDSRRWIFNHYRDTMPRYGRYPTVDDHSFYLSYHALFCAAGELLAKKPTSNKSDWRGWDSWLKEHLLTRPDGKWLADRRDFAPLERRRWQQTEDNYDQRKYWRWSILAEDFDQALGVVGPDPKSMVVWGRWNVSDYSHWENISVSTALVTAKTSLALLRALQTADDCHDYYIPPEGERPEIADKDFKMSGWILTPYPELELDRCDPFGGKIPWPGPMPGRSVRRVFGLTPSDDGRLWQDGDLVVMRALLWGDRNEDRYNRTGNYGERLTAALGFILGILRQLNRDLIIKVEIDRDDGRKEDEIQYKYRFCARIYLLRTNGELHTLEGCRRLRPSVS